MKRDLAEGMPPALMTSVTPDGAGDAYQIISISVPAARAQSLLRAAAWKDGGVTLHAIGGDLVEMLDEGNGRKTLRIGFFIIGVES